jgi:hypothetical protein
MNANDQSKHQPEPDIGTENPNGPESEGTDGVEKTLILTLSDNIGSLDNQLDVSPSLTSPFYCLLFTLFFSPLNLFWILTIPITPLHHYAIMPLRH